MPTINFDVRNRWTGNVQFTASIECAEDAPLKIKVGLALKWGYESNAVLSGAVLRDAVLSGADLRGADLRGAVLRGADLSGADLRGADLSGAVLRDAVLRGAVLSGADLSGADLRGADLRGAVLRDADLRGVPVVPHIDAAILHAVENGGRLQMDAWHTCETTHCRAGWAIHLAGDAGRALEFALGSAGAGSLIYAASRPGKPIPNFYATNEAALEDLRAGAAEDPLPTAA